ncbi:MAG: TIGR03960 family B12-binding radical SAM protein, partial [Actinomycetota bacterium]|nr:TIGR03960 family B12-binding radical SAM protein [Actinomycetota bacterium]
MNLWPQIEQVLREIEKPSRYINHELNSVHKEVSEEQIRIALAYPDTYEVGLPNTGLWILYEILNAQEDVFAERVYAPWTDMESRMRKYKIPLFTLETHSKVADLDVLGFSFQHELLYTNVLNMLDLAGIPVFSSDRNETHPLIIAGGPATVNPEPMSPFIDLFVIGEAEELILELIAVLRDWKKYRKKDKQDLLKQLSAIPGIYVPSFYEVSYKESGQVKEVKPLDGASAVVTRRIVKDLGKVTVPAKPVVPFMDTVHDRCSVEIMRGCTRGCRFCQAGIIYRPVRERPKDQIISAVSQILQNTGYEEISLSSLSSTDYTLIEDVLKELANKYSSQGISISLPSLRVDTFSVQLVKEIARVKKTGLTFAPEAGTQRLRDVINKNVGEDDIIRTVQAAFEAGWQRIKLYFMVGLPTETDEDLQGIVDLAKKIVRVGLQTLDRASRSRLMIVLNVSSFAPKPHTPFQWVAQNSLDEFERKQRFIGSGVRGNKHLSFKWHDASSSVLEGALARGDRRVANVIYRAWQLGCRFDAWTSEFKFNAWMQAFK